MQFACVRKINEKLEAKLLPWVLPSGLQRIFHARSFAAHLFDVLPRFRETNRQIDGVWCYPLTD